MVAFDTKETRPTTSCEKTSPSDEAQAYETLTSSSQGVLNAQVLFGGVRARDLNSHKDIELRGI